MKFKVASVLYGLCLLLPLTIFAEDSYSGWKNTQFVESANINLLANYKHYIYAAGSNESGYGTSWLYSNNHWQNIYQAKDNSAAIDTTIVADKFYVAGNYPGKGSWLVEYLPQSNTSVNLPINFANHISQIENLNELLFVSGADLQERGAVWVHSPIKGWDKISSAGYNYISEMALAPNGVLYAAAINSKTNKAKILAYSHIKKTWSDTHLPKNIVLIWSLIADKNNVIYAGGMDESYRAQVWKFEHNKWLSLKLDNAQNISSLELDKNGTLYAAGKDETFSGQVWMYNKQHWQKLNFPPSDNVNSIIIDESGVLYATAKDNRNYSLVWVFQVPQTILKH